jgi:hypothetical protein
MEPPSPPKRRRFDDARGLKRLLPEMELVLLSTSDAPLLLTLTPVSAVPLPLLPPCTVAARSLPPTAAAAAGHIYTG